MELDKLNIDLFIEILEKRNVKVLREIFDTIPTIDIAEFCNEIEDVKLLVFIFKTVKSEYTSDLFTELDNEVQEKLIQIMSDKELAELLDEQFTDDIVDFLEDLPANLISRVLSSVGRGKREEVNKLLNYKKHSAGSIMTTEYLMLNGDISADEAIKYIRKEGHDKETIFTIFIRDDKRNLVGTLDLDDLIFADGEKILSSIMNRDFVTVNVNIDQEEVAQIVSRYDLNAVAVLNDDNKICGIITIDDIFDVIEEETTEDISNLNLVTPLEDSYLKTSSWSMAKKCVPWIIVLLISGTLSSLVLSLFQDKLAVIPILAVFIPVLMDTGGNAGGQTIALMIRGLALKEFSPKQFFKVLSKELLTALITALIIGIFAFVWFSIEQYTGLVHNSLAYEANKLVNPNVVNDFATIWNGECWSFAFAIEVFKISGLVSATLVLTTMVSKMLAVCLPLAVVSFKKDPAIVSQPLLTTLVDVSSLLIYFAIATSLISVL